MDEEELGPVLEFQQWFDQHPDSVVFFLIQGSKTADGTVRLEFSMSDGGQGFSVFCPPDQAAAYAVKADADSLRPWADALQAYARAHAGQIKLAGLLAEAVALRATSARSPPRRRASGDDDSDLGDELSDDDDQLMDADDESDDGGAFTTDWDIRMDLRKKAWQAKEDELRKEWEEEKRKASNASATVSTYASAFDPDPYGYDEESSHSLAPKKTSDAGSVGRTATKEGQQIFSHASAAFQILSNELIALLKAGPEEGLVCDSVHDSLYSWDVRIGGFEDEPLKSQMEKLRARHGYAHVEFQLDFVPDFPFYPPMLKVIRPRFNGSLVQSLANSDLLKLTWWNPATTVKDVLRQIKQILQNHAKVDYESERNDPVKFPDGAYASVEDDLIKLALATEIRPRANFAILDVENLEKAPQFRIKADSAEKEDEESGAKKGRRGKGGWARGTGYGSGMMRSGWDPDSLLKAQAEKERQILKILKSLVGHLREEAEMDAAEKKEVFSIIEASALIPFFEAELMHPSFIEIGQHMDKFAMLLQLLGAFAARPSLLPLLCPLENQGAPVLRLLAGLAETAKEFLDALSRTMRGKTPEDSASGARGPAALAFASLMQKRKAGKSRGRTTAKRAAAAAPAESEESGPEEEEDAETANARNILSVFRRLTTATAAAGLEWEAGMDEDEPSTSESSDLGERYQKALRPLQYGTYEAVTESGAPWAHKFGAKKPKAGGGELGAPEIRRIFKELTALRTSLPLDVASSVAVRVDEGKLHLLRAVILGPDGTPYANGAFVFDVAFPPGYPKTPPEVNIITTGGGSVRFNPNLYDNGKVCLSLLGTWSGAKGEQWNPATSTLLQVLVSIQSLIMVDQPYFNEPGYESSLGTSEGDNRSREYNKNIRAGTVKWAMLEQLKNPPPGFADLIRSHFALKKDAILELVKKWEEEDSTNKNLKSSVKALKEELAKLPKPH